MVWPGRDEKRKSEGRERDETLVECVCGANYAILDHTQSVVVPTYDGGEG